MAKEEAGATYSGRMPRKLLDAVDEIARREDRSRNWVITRLVEEALDTRAKVRR